MQNDMRRKLVLFTIVVAAANLLDLVSTYVASPDLANEWNVLVRCYGFGWLGLLTAKVIGGALAIAGYAFYLVNRERCYPNVRVDYNGFCHYFAFGSCVKVPSERGDALRHLLMVAGYLWAGMQAIVVWVAVDNFLLKLGFSWGIRAHSEVAYHFLQSLGVTAVVLHLFFGRNYQRFASRMPAPA